MAELLVKETHSEGEVDRSSASAIAEYHKYNKLQETGIYEFLIDRDKHDIYSILLTPDGKYMIASFQDGSIEIVNIEGEKPTLYRTAMHRKFRGLPFICVRMYPNDPEVFCAGSAEGVLYKFNIHDEKKDSYVEMCREYENEIHTFDFSSNGEHVATAGKDLTIRLYDTKTAKLIRTWQGYKPQRGQQNEHSHSQRIYCLKYMKDQSTFANLDVNNTFVTCGWDNQIKIWDSRMEDGVVKSISGPHVCGDAIDFSGYKLLTGSYKPNHALELFDLRYYSKIGESLPFRVNYSGQKDIKEQIKHHTNIGEYIYSCRFYDDDTVVAGGSGTHSVQAISISRGEVIGEMLLTCKSRELGKKNKSVHCIDVVKGRKLAFGGSSDRIFFGTLLEEANDSN